MIALIIIAAVIVLIIVLLFLPVSANLSFEGDFSVKIKLAGIKLYDSEKKSAENPKEKPEKCEEKKENTFLKLKNRYGFSGAVKEILGFVKAVLRKIKKQLKKILIRRLKIDIRVASPDAAQTAVEYGVVCAAVYPLLSFLESTADIGIKQINVSSDFNSQKPHFSFSAVVRLRIIYLIIAAFAPFCEYNKFKTRNEL